MQMQSLALADVFFYCAASKLKRDQQGFLFSYLDFEEQSKLQQPVVNVNAPFLVHKVVHLLPLYIRTFYLLLLIFLI